MLHIFVDPADMEGDILRIGGSEYNHIRNVLRLVPGDEISVGNGVDQKEYRYGIEGYENNAVVCRLRFVKEDDVELPVRVYLFQGIPKSDKMDFIIQKSVELGVFAVIPLKTQRCVVKLDESRAARKIERWQSIALSAAGQSRRRIIPHILPPMNMKEAAEFAHSHTDCRMIPYELQGQDENVKEFLESIPKGSSVSVFIGPEGGFTPEEIQIAREAGIRPISLGRRILRTETAALTVLSWMIYVMEIT